MRTPEAPGVGIYTRHNFLSIYLPAITLAIGTGIIIPALPVYARSFGVSFEVASLVIIVEQIGHTSASLPTGWLMDRFGRRKVVLAGPVLLALSSLLCAFAQSFPELLLWRFLGGVGQMMWMLGRLTMIADTGADSERGRQITTMHSMEASGRLLSPVLGGFLAVLWDIRAPFIAHSVLSLLAIIPSFILVRETAPHLAPGKPVEAVPAVAGASLASLFTRPIVAFFIAQFFASVARGPIFTGQMNLYAAYVYDLGPEKIGFLATAMTAVGIPISLCSGYIMDRFGRKTTLVPGFSLLALALAVISVSAFESAPLMVFVLAYLGVHAANAITGGNMQALASDIAPVTARGRFYGVSQTLGSVGGPISTSAFALLSHMVGYWSAFGFLGVMAGGAAIIIATQVRDRIRDRAATR